MYYDNNLISQLYPQLLVQIIIVASFVGAIVCQHYNSHQHQGIQAQSHFYLHQNHPAPTTVATPSHVTPYPSYHQHTYSNQQQLSTSAPSYMDLDKFNQQAKTLKDQLIFFNQQQSQHLRNQMNSVHQDGSEPHFDFVINQNYSDLEKASEQFVNLGSMAAKQNMPKVIKITKTVAVKQPVPVPYPVPIVKYVKEQVPFQHQKSHDYQHSIPTALTMPTEKPFDFKPSPFYSNYTSYISKFPPQNENQNNVISHTTSSPVTSTGMAMAHKIAESYIKQEFFSTPASLAAIGEYDTRPFYVTTSEKEMIKYIPVPYYVDENGNRHELPASSSSSEDKDNISSGNGDSYFKQSSTASPASAIESHSGKFQSFTFSYHPPQTTTSSYSSYTTPSSLPEAKFYYSQGEVASVPISSVADNTISSSHHYSVSEVDSNDDENDEHGHIQYKYVYE